MTECKNHALHGKKHWRTCQLVKVENFLIILIVRPLLMITNKLQQQQNFSDDSEQFNVTIIHIQK